MTARRARRSLLVLLALAVGPAPARGEEPPTEVPAAVTPAASDAPLPPSAEEVAKQRFARGLVLAGDRAWDAALAEFLASLELFPTRAATFNAALSLREVHRYDEALELLETLLTRYPDLPESERRAAERELEELEQRVALLDIRVAEPGALVMVDGRKRGTTPLAPVRVAAGSRLLVLHKPGFLPFELRLDVAGAQTRVVEAKLGPLMRAGGLRVEVEGAQPATVFIDGIPVGTAPLRATLPEGQHVVWLQGQAASLGTQPALARVAQNRDTALSLALEPLTARVRVETTPASALITFDGVPVTSGVWEAPVRAGGHRLEVSAEGFVTRTLDLSLQPGQPRTVRAELEPHPESAAFVAKHPPRVVVAAALGAGAASTLGADLGCSGPCREGTPIGARATLRLGYQLGIGVGAALDLGYVRLSQTVSERSTFAIVQPSGPTHPGSAEDHFELSLFSVGASVFYHWGAPLAFEARLGGGASVGSFSDRRHAKLAWADESASPPELPPSGAVDYEAVREQEYRAPALYLAGEFRAGYALSDRFELGLGLELLVLSATRAGAWDGAGSAFLTSCPPDRTTICTRSSLAEFASEKVQARTVGMLGLLAGARYSF